MSSTTVGGSGRSQRELAGRLEAQGREVRFLVEPHLGSPVRRRLLNEARDGAARFGDRLVGRFATAMGSRIGRRPQRTVIEGREHLVTIAPENAFGRLAEDFRPDLVVGSSIDRVTWRRIRDRCAVLGIATILYVREEAAVGHIGVVADAERTLANAAALTDLFAGAGVQAVTIPSVVEITPIAPPPRPEVAMVINPIASHGVELIGALARAVPDLTFLLQESWPLTAHQRSVIDRIVAEAPNVEFRPRVDGASALFGRTRLLLAPHRVDNRPRVIHEAAVNGIPTIVAAQPGLVEAAGAGGLVAGAPDDVEAWARTLRSVLDDPDLEDRLRRGAIEHAGRDDMNPEIVAARFGAEADQVVAEFTLDRAAASST